MGDILRRCARVLSATALVACGSSKGPPGPADGGTFDASEAAQPDASLGGSADSSATDAAFSEGGAIADGGGDAGACAAATAPWTVTLATGLAGPAGIVVDGDSVYWVDRNDGTIMTVSVDGGTPSILATVAGQPHSIAIDATNVYVTDNALGNVVRVSRLDGGAAPIATGQTGAQGITVDTTNVYWTLGASGSTAVMQAPKMSTDNAGTSLLVSGASGPQGVAVDATRVYWVTYYGGLVQAASLDGGGLVTLASAQSYPEAIAVTGGAAYWTTSNALGGAPLDGGPSFVAATDQENPTSGGLNTDVGIAVDATYVYWADYSGGALNATALGGGPLLEVGAGQNPLGVAVDTTSIYWTDYGAGTVKKTSKCLLATGTVAYLPD